MIAFKPPDVSGEDHDLLRAEGLAFLQTANFEGRSVHCYQGRPGSAVIGFAPSMCPPWLMYWTPDGQLQSHIVWADNLMTLLWIYEAVIDD